MIGRPAVMTTKEHPADELTAYLPLLRGVDAATLDPLGVLQLVRVHLAVHQAAEAAALGRSALAAGKIGDDPAVLSRLIELIGPLLRDRLNDAAGAFEAWASAAKLAKTPELKARFEVEAADVALHDLLKADAAKALLDAATAQVTSRRLKPPRDCTGFGETIRRVKATRRPLSRRMPALMPPRPAHGERRRLARRNAGR